MVDLGVGLAVEMDQASMQPVARLKFKNLVSIKVRRGKGMFFLDGCIRCKCEAIVLDWVRHSLVSPK